MVTDEVLDEVAEGQNRPLEPLYPLVFFPTDESVTELLFLALNLAEKERKMPAREWAMAKAKAQFAILFEDRMRIAG